MITEILWTATQETNQQTRRRVRARWVPILFPAPTLLALGFAIYLAVDGLSFVFIAVVTVLSFLLGMLTFWLESRLHGWSPQRVHAPVGTVITARYHHYSMRVHSRNRYWRIDFADIRRVRPNGRIILLGGKRDTVLPAELMPPHLIEFVRARAGR